MRLTARSILLIELFRASTSKSGHTMIEPTLPTRKCERILAGFGENEPKNSP